MGRAFYSSSIEDFSRALSSEVVGRLKMGAVDEGFPPTDAQVYAWSWEVEYLQRTLRPWPGTIYLEFSIPRMGRRIDAVVLTGPLVLVIEFKVGHSNFEKSAIEQVWDYALDLKNFHEGSHAARVVPVLIVTEGTPSPLTIATHSEEDGLLNPRLTTPTGFPGLLQDLFAQHTLPELNPRIWEAGRYRPTPTIIEAAIALYRQHSVADLTRTEAGERDLAVTSRTLNEIIRTARTERRKAICFVTGVPGSGKTLIGLNAATAHLQNSEEPYSVFLSGNGPLVSVLCEALARDHVRSSRESQHPIHLGEARSRVKAFVQNVHRFRDECLKDPGPPVEHIAIFDEAQRAWNVEQTSRFMRRRKHQMGFSMSEPEFLIQCLDRHHDWAVIICLVGGGQEINTGEAGIGEWISAVNRSFPLWEVYISPTLTDREYTLGGALDALRSHKRIVEREGLHLSTSLRSFRAENISTLVRQILDLDLQGARVSLATAHQFPIRLTRDLTAAKKWVRTKARGSERYGVVVSSQAERLKPHAISVHAPVDPIHWFLGPKEDVRSSFYLEDVATEFHIQGLELDWACVTWDADLRWGREAWEHWSFRGDRWERMRKPERQRYLENAYRVLLTRARQGMVIVVPEGDPDDPTRSPEFYDPTFDYLRMVGFPILG